MSKVNAEEIINYLNLRAGRRYKNIPVHTKLINARAAEGYDIDDFKYVIDVKCEEWKGTTMDKFLRPATLFQASKFDGYLNQPKRFNDDPFSMEDLPF